MADSPVKSNLDLAKEEIVCPLCFGVFDNPRSLQCLHSYCEECLYGLHKSTLFAGTLTCPECRANTVLSKDGVKGLKINFKLKRFVELLSAEEKQLIVRNSSFRHRPVPPPPPPPSPTCTAHPGKELEFYCGECVSLICSQCMLETHRLHNNVQCAKLVLEERIQSLKTCTTPADSMLSKASSVLDRLQSHSNSVLKAANVDTVYAQNYFGELRSLLDEREKDVCRSIHAKAHRQESGIARQRQVVNNAIEDIQKSKMTIRDIVGQRNDDVHVLIEERNITQKLDSQVQHLGMLLEKAKQKGKPSYQSPFVPDPDFEAHCKVVGQRSDSSVDSPTVLPRHTFVGTPGPGRSRFATVSKFSQRDFSHSLSSARSSDLASPTLGKSPTFKGSLTSSLNSSSEVFLPDGSPKRTYQIDGVTILTPSLVINSGSLLGPTLKLSNASPCGVCNGKSNTLIVTDSKNHMYSILTPTGKFLDFVQAEGKGDGQFTELTAVSTDLNERVIVLDKGSPSRVQVLSYSGKFLSKFKVRGALSGSYLGHPLGLVVLYDGNVLVSDSEKSCVHVYEESGRYQGKFGDSDVRMKEPAGITVDSRGNVIITDRGHHCIWIYTCGGHYLLRAGKQGSGPGDLLYPYGVAVNSEGSIFVSESGNHRISVFTAGGKFVRSFGKKGSEPGMFLYPRHLCVDSQGRLVVADEHNQRVQIFSDIDHEETC